MTKSPRKNRRGTLALFRDDRQEMIRPDVLEDLTEAERDEIFYEEISERGAAKDRAVKLVQRALGAESRRGRSCPGIFEAIRARFAVKQAQTNRQVWDDIAAEDSLNIYLGDDGRMHEDANGKNKSISFRTFARYCTQARSSPSQ